MHSRSRVCMLCTNLGQNYLPPLSRVMPAGVSWPLPSVCPRPPCCLPPSSSLSISPCLCFCLWPTSAGCLEVLLIRMCRVFNVNNGTIFFNGKFAPPHFFKALGENRLLKGNLRLASLISCNVQQTVELPVIPVFSPIVQGVMTWSVPCSTWGKAFADCSSLMKRWLCSALPSFCPLVISHTHTGFHVGRLKQKKPKKTCYSSGSCWLTFPVLTGRTAVAEGRPEGSETPGEGLPGAAAQPTPERLRREAGQGEVERRPSP